MTTKQPQPAPTPDEIWAILKEVSASQKETSASQKETDREIKATARQMKETDRQMKATDRRLDQKFAETDREIKETAKQMKETDRRLDQKFAETDRKFKKTDKMLTKSHNLFTTQWGKLMESLVRGDLVKLLNQKGINIQNILRNEPGRMRYTDEHGSEQEMLCEIDLIARNGGEVVAVEVKTTLRVKDVKKFLDTLPKFTLLLSEYSGKKVYGAVAYLQADEYSGDYAEKKGLFVIRATGNSASIINGKGFKAKVFG